MLDKTDPNHRVSSRVPNGVPPLELSVKRVSIDSVGATLESPAASSWTSLGHEAGSMDGASQMALASDFDDDDKGGVCGWGPFNPRCLQKLRSPKTMLIFLCLAGALQGMVVNGFVNVVITTIERRFNLRSFETGLIAGAYDIGCFLCLIPVSYFGASGRKPRWLGLGMLILGVGSLLFASPHFFSGKYKINNVELEERDICFPSNNSYSSNNSLPNNSTSTQCTSANSDSFYKYVFFLGQFLHGVGATPLYTLGVAFLDENVPTKMSSVYVGTYYAMAIIGPAIGYLLGGQFLKIYVDITEDPSELNLNPSSNVWVGAWWIGFIMSGVLSCIMAIPILAFPKSLPGAKRIQSEKVSEAHGGKEASQLGFGDLKHLPAALKGLLTNPCFIFLSLAGACEALLLNGFAAFLPKYIESQFGIGPTWAALTVGAITIPTGGGGTFLGGYLVKRFSLRCAGIVKLCVTVTLVSLLCTLIFMIHCENVPFMGVNVNRLGERPSFSSNCSESCSCTDEIYDPICGVDDSMYYSPCYAGCRQMFPDGDKKWYGNCSCINVPPIQKVLNGQNITVMASGNKCENKCNLLPLFLSVAFVFMMFTFLASMPALSATLRCVSSNLRSFSLGIQWLFIRALGSIPAPIFFGHLVDSTCSLWQILCDENGSCRAYDNKVLSRTMMILAMVVKSISLMCFTIAWAVYKPPKQATTENGNFPGLSNLETKNAEISVIGADADDSGYSAGSAHSNRLKS